MNEHPIQLPDGRRLAYVECGDPSGHPTMFFHGVPGSRLQAMLAAQVAAAAGVRLIAPDRPGVGASDFQPRRHLLDWPADVLQLADHLGLARFSVLGVSGGGPYALACAHAIPERLDAVGVVSGIAPLDDNAMLDGMQLANKTVLRIAKRAPGLLRGLLQPAIAMRAFPDHTVRLLAVTFGEPDGEVLRRPVVRHQMAVALAESLRQGVAGNVDEVLILARPWGFAPEDVSARLHLWHGGRDRVVPPSHCRYLQERLPWSDCQFHPGDGHFSLVIDHLPQIFATLAEARRRRQDSSIRDKAHRPAPNNVLNER